MLNENIKNLRKQRGMSQEALAQQLNVVRQTVSKWEKGLSVPDAEMLMKIAEFFEVPVSELLGVKITEESSTNDVIAAQLALLNEQLAKRSRRSKIIHLIIGIAAVIYFGLPLVFELAIIFSSFAKHR